MNDALLQRLAVVALAGALGTLARYVLSVGVQRAAGGDYLWGTLAVNVLGCFLFGLVWSLANERLVINREAQVILLGGFMGAFTTFSTFIFETHGFVQEARWLLATGHVLLQTVVGMGSLFIGMIVARLF
jgi:CrcB protein